MQTKYCLYCKKEHPLYEFYNKSESKDGKDSSCKISRLDARKKEPTAFFNVHDVKDSWIC